MRSKIVAAVVLAVASLVAVPALAQDGGKGEAKFPMPAAAFKAKVDARTAKAKSRMEAHAAKLPADKAKELRTKFDAGVAQINQEVAKATADGTVTKDEAQKVRAVAKSVRSTHGKGHRHGAKHDGKKPKK